MRRRIAAAFAALTAIGYIALGRATDERNARVLAAHVGCSLPEARRLYRLARRIGYGAAYAQVFPGQAIAGIPPYGDLPSATGGRSGD